MRDNHLSSYMGEQDFFVIPGEYLQGFIRSIVEFRIKVTNCYGDSDTVRRHIEVYEGDLFSGTGASPT